MQRFFPEGQLINTASNIAHTNSVFSLTEAMEQKVILEARAIMCDKEHNLIVGLGSGIRGIIPREEGALGIADGTTRDIAIISRVNKPVCFTVMEIYKEGSDTIAKLSRREAQEICKANYLDNLLPGQILSGRITHIEPFGCFVDIGCGISSLLPIDSISVSRISHPKDRFSVGQTIRGIVKSNEDGRICLTHKELLGTWNDNADMFSPGQTVSGIIRSVESYGVFVELSPNLAGLAEPFEGAKIGQHASVYIKSLIPEKMKVKLIIIDCFDASYPPEDVYYFLDGDFIDRWVYSPPNCNRLFATDFV